MRSRLVLSIAVFFAVTPHAYAAAALSHPSLNSQRWLAGSDSKSVVVNNWQGEHPSFDCAKAVTKVEKMICGSDRLAELDGRLGLLYISSVVLS